MSQDQNAGQSNSIKIASSSFERLDQFKYLETTLMNQNSIHKETNSRLKSKNASYHSAQYILSSSLVSKNIKTKM